MKTRYLVIGLVLVTIVAAFFTIGNRGGGGGITGNVVGTASAASMEIPLSDISEQASFYEYDVNGVKVRFFAIMGSDGSIKTAFDACDVCYGSKKGYRQEGDVMICNNCGNRYPISGLGTENKAGGGCWPGYLPSSISGDSLVVMAADLKKGAYRF